mgnify:CR=1 FL=1
MISIDRFEEILSDLAEEIPQSFYEELNGGIVVEPGYLLHPEDRSGTLYVNGEPVAEPYVKFNKGMWNLPPRKVSPGYVYVVGDNRGMPMEQHKFGQIRKSRIQGTLLL